MQQFSPLYQEAAMFSAAAARLSARCDQASAVLADIQAIRDELAIPRAKFADDDWYVYDPASLELHEVISCKSWRGQQASTWRPPEVEPGLKVALGMQAKNLGLWRLA